MTRSLILVGLTVAPASFACLSAGAAEDSSAELVWVAEVNRSRPLAYRNESGDWTGFEIDRLNLVAKSSGHKIKYRELSDPRDRFQALREGTADIVLGGNTITSAREANSIDFTFPTFDSGLSIAVPWHSGKESGSRLMSVVYAYAHWELIPLSLAAFVLACVFFRQLKRSEANSVIRGSLAMIGLVAIIIMVHADVMTRLHDRDEVIAKITKPDDLMGVGVATKRQTTSSELLPTYGARIHLTDTIEDALRELRNSDDVEAVVFDSPVLWYYAIQGEFGQLRVVGDQFAQQKYGLAVRQDDDELLEMLNRSLLEQDEQGLTEQLRKVYFGNYR